MAYDFIPKQNIACFIHFSTLHRWTHIVYIFMSLAFFTQHFFLSI